MECLSEKAADVDPESIQEKSFWVNIRILSSGMH
jgi:hypothetical protein